MVVTHSSSTLKKWQTENIYRFHKLNATIKKDPYPLPFKGEMLNTVEGYEKYYFLDGYLIYHKIFIALEDIYKTAFVMDWGALYGGHVVWS